MISDIHSLLKIPAGTLYAILIIQNHVDRVNVIQRHRIPFGFEYSRLQVYFFIPVKKQPAFTQAGGEPRAPAAALGDGARREGDSGAGRGGDSGAGGSQGGQRRPGGVEEAGVSSPVVQAERRPRPRQEVEADGGLGAERGPQQLLRGGLQRQRERGRAGPQAVPQRAQGDAVQALQGHLVQQRPQRLHAPLRASSGTRRRHRNDAAALRR